jgi:hypothetical protein
MNPLTSYMRQPKIYIRLPSNGKYWPEGSIDIPSNGELPVYSMTAKDEITLKTPDALLNGQAVVDIIHSCFPNIKNAWVCPSIDIDTLLVALRIATYGDMMDISHIVPNTTEEVSHTIDLKLILEQLNAGSAWKENLSIRDDITCFIQPLTYAHISRNSMRTFEAQRVIQLLTREDLDEDRKIELLNQSVATMSDIAFELIVESVRAIQTHEILVEDREFIKDFLQNADKTIFDQIEKHLNEMRLLIGIKPLEFTSDQEHVDLGAPEKYSMPLNMDNSSFFVLGS